MRILVAGAAGVIGRHLTPMLVEAGHAVVGTTRSKRRAAWLEGTGATPALLDVLDADAVRSLAMDVRPDVVIHQLTDLSGGFARDSLARNARLRVVGTRNLVRAAVAAGARRLVVQSAAWLYADGRLPHVESDSLCDPDDAPQDVTLRGILDLERQVLTTHQLEGVILRYGFIYGPGTGVRRQQAPLPRVHVKAAARAAMIATERGSAGVYNVVDDGGPVSNRLAREALDWLPTG